jgi:hypothetical protein
VVFARVSFFRMGGCYGGWTGLTLPSLSLDVPSYRPNSKQHSWNRTENIYAQSSKFSECIFVWVERVIVDEHLFSDFESIFPRALPSGEALVTHREDVSVTIVIGWLVSGDNTLRCLLTRGDVSVHSPLMNKENCADCPR